jgi:putative hydrolase of the HAD superfamily
MKPELDAPVRAVTFDLDFTLWDLTGVIASAEQRAQDWLARHHPEVAERWDLEAMARLRAELAERRPELRHDVTALRREAFREAGQRCGCPPSRLAALVEGAFDEFIAGRHELTFYPDTRPLLDALHQRVRLGVITNGNAEVSRLGLEHYFDFSLSAMEVGAAKPSHLVFDTAVHRAGAPPAHIVHVGDDVECDVVGAARAGMQAVWLNRDGSPWPRGLERVAHVEVDSLAALGELLDSVLVGRKA